MLTKEVMNNTKRRMINWYWTSRVLMRRTLLPIRGVIVIASGKKGFVFWWPRAIWQIAYKVGKCCLMIVQQWRFLPSCNFRAVKFRLESVDQDLMVVLFVVFDISWIIFSIGKHWCIYDNNKCVYILFYTHIIKNIHNEHGRDVYVYTQSFVTNYRLEMIKWAFCKASLLKGKSILLIFIKYVILFLI